MTSISPFELNDNIFKLIDKVWMLVTAGTTQNYNTMTASWGGFGILWNKPVSFIFIRPQRHTYQFVESNPNFTLCFFNEKYREALKFCGTKSGRNIDKAKETGLTPININGSVAFKEARIIIECTKLYSQNLEANSFVYGDIITNNYPTSDFHRMYIGEINRVNVEQ